MKSYEENTNRKEGAKVQFCALVALGAMRAQGLKRISRLVLSIAQRFALRSQ
jgi:hypothetical protein